MDVYAADQIPAALPEDSFCFVANTDPIDKPGQHWVAFVKREGREPIFIDSYGNAPTTYNPRLWRRFSGWKKSQYDLQQNTSTVCGDWCLYFLRVLNRNGKLTLDDVVKQFDVNDDEGNDSVIFQAVHELYPRILDSENHPNVEKMSSQGCTSREK